MIDYASHLDLHDTKNSSQIYLKILSSLKSDKNSELTPSIQIYSNMGVTFMKNSMYEKANEVFQIGLEQIQNCIESGEIRANFQYSFSSKKSCMGEKLSNENVILLKSLKQTILYNRAMLEEKKGRFREAVKQYKLILLDNPLMVEARLRLVRIFHLKGNLYKKINKKGQSEQMEKELSQSLIITQEQQSDLSKLTLSAFTYLQFLNKNYSRVLHLLSKLKMDENTDTYMFNMMSTCVYKLITLKRNETLEVKKMIKIAAEKANLIISKKDEQNSSSAVLLGNLLAERGKLKESKQIFEQIMSYDKTAVYNAAFLEYLMMHYGKALTILQSPQSPPKWRRKTIFAILLVLNKRFKDGEKKMKYKLLRKPNRKNYFNYASIIHEKVKRIFQKRKGNLNEMKSMISQLDWAKKVFKSISNFLKNKTQRKHRKTCSCF